MSPIEVAFERFKIMYREAVWADAQLRERDYDDAAFHLMKENAKRAWASAEKLEAELKWLFPRRRTR